MERGEGGGGASTLYDEPVSPLGRTCLLPLFEQVIHWVFTFQNPVDIDAVKAVLKSSLINNCPRLRSLVVTGRNGRQRWKELPEVNVDNHVIIVPEEEDFGKEICGGEESEEERENDIYISEYVAALASSPPMRREIPLWEMHVLPRRRRCFVLRFHHALGDGISLLALILASCERAGKPGIPITYSRGGGEGKRRAEFSLETSITGIAAGTWRTVKKAWYTLLYSVDTSIKLIRPREDMMAIAGLVGVDLLPRKLATLALCLDDMKAVKNKLNATINDVFVGIISCGIAKYLKLKSSNEASKDCVITALSSVSTRGKGSKDVLRSIKEGKKVVWGNKLGYFLLPLHLKRRSDDPLNYVRKARAMLNRRKLSLQPQYSYKCCALIMNLLGSKVADSLGYKMFSSMSLVLSNIVGPLDAITFAKNRITKMGVTTTSLPLPLEIHMLTYDGKAFLNVLVAADIIHDPELLCLCFQEALRDMKSKVMNAEKYDGKILFRSA